MVIYKTTNLLNGKYYIGKDEKNNPEYLGSGKILKLALNKNGRDNFKKEILEICETREKLNEREIYWIDSLSATTLGYNISNGGTGGRTKYKKVYQYNKNGSFIKEWSSAAEVEKKLGFDSSSILKTCKGKLFSVKGFIWSYECIESGINEYSDNKSFKVLQYSKDGDFIKEWESMIKAEKNIGLTRGNIFRVVDKINKTSGGFVWLKKNGDIKEKLNINKFDKHNIKPISQYDKNMKLINKWISLSEASQKLKISKSSISIAAKNKTLFKENYWIKE